MASLANQTISSTYDGLIKTSSDNAVPVSGVQALEDGSGNALALSVGRSGNGVTVSGNLAVDTDTLYVDAAANEVGIGTSTPAAKFHINAGAVSSPRGGGFTKFFLTSDSYTYFELQTPSTETADIIFSDGAGGNYGVVGYTHSDDSMHFYTAASEAMRIDSSGNVGIGTQSADDLLHLQGSETVVSATQLTLEGRYAGYGAGINFVSRTSNEGTRVSMAKITADGENSWSTTASTQDAGLRFFTTENGSQSERMRIDSSGNVGIGTNNPASVSGYTSLTLNNSTSGGIMYFQQGGGNKGYLYNSSSNMLLGSVSGELIFEAAASEAMRIDSSGNVAIGSSNAFGHDLFVKGKSGAAGVVYAVGNSSSHRGEFAVEGSGQFTGGFAAVPSGASTYNGIPASTVGITTSSTPLVFATSNTERMRITSNGNVLINTDVTPDASNGGFGVFPSGGSTYIYNSTEQSTSWFHLQFINPNGIVGSISTNGSATSFNTSSDYRLKENVVPMEGALDRVDALKPSRFNFIADPEKTVDGFIAHEVQAIVPEAVTGEKDAVEEYEVTPAVLDEEGNVIEEAVMGTRPVYQGIDQSKIVPLLVGAIQELRAEIESLKSQLNA